MALLQHSLCVVKRVFPRHKTVTKRISSTAANSTLGVLGGTISVTALLQAQPRRLAHDPARTTRTHDRRRILHVRMLAATSSSKTCLHARGNSTRRPRRFANASTANTTDVFSPQIGNAYESPNLPSPDLIDHPAVIPKVRGLYGDRNSFMQSGWCAQAGGQHRRSKRQLAPGRLRRLRISKKLLIHCPYCNCAPVISLTDQSHEFMGNMMMIPGSHRSPVLAARRTNAQRGERHAYPAQYPLQALGTMPCSSTTASGTRPCPITRTSTATICTTSIARPGCAEPIVSPLTPMSGRRCRRCAAL